MREAINQALAQSDSQHAVVAVTGDALSLSPSQVMAPTGVASLDAFSSAPTGAGTLDPISAPHYVSSPRPMPIPMQPAGSWTPHALPAPAPGPYGASFPMGAPPQASTPWGCIVAALGVVVLLAASAGFWLFAKRSQQASVDVNDETASTAVPIERPDDEPGSVATPTESTPEKRVKECAGVRTLGKPALKRHLTAIGWRVTGTLIYCPGTMINFRCQGAQSDGVTVSDGGDGKGSLALMRFAAAARAQSYVDGESADVTLARSGNVVLRIEMPEDAADALTARICR
jgi:hypothetical protein